MLKEPKSLIRTMITGVAAGLAAGVVVKGVDKVASTLVSEEQKQREKSVREDSAHKMAGPYFAGKIMGRELSQQEQQRARAVFGVAYGTLWGLIYAGVRERFPQVSRFMGFPFAVPFFFGCDGTMVPLLGVSPGIQHLPWQINAKELGNHIVWTVTAEAVHRMAERIPSGGLDEIIARTLPSRQEERVYGHSVESNE
ncbi:MAG: hypothetical protein ACLFQR_02380 [Desulfovibrionales bacterium]